MVKARLIEIKLYLQKVKDICKNNDDLCKSCPFAIQRAINYNSCVFNDVPEDWSIDKMKEGD